MDLNKERPQEPGEGSRRSWKPEAEGHDWTAGRRKHTLPRHEELPAPTAAWAASEQGTGEGWLPGPGIITVGNSGDRNQPSPGDTLDCIFPG